MNQTREIKLNLIISIFAKGSAALLRVATIPLILYYWNGEKLGAWILLSALPTWASMMDLGLSTQTANAVTIYYSQNNISEAQNIFKTAYVTLTVFSSSILILSIPVVLSINLNNFLNIRCFSAHELSISLILLIASTLISFQRGIYTGHYRAKGKSPLAIGLTALAFWMDLIGQIVGLYLTMSPIGLAGGMLIARILHIFIYNHIGKRLIPEISPSQGKYSITEARSCLKKGLAFCLLPLGYSILMDGSLLIIGNKLGSEAAAIYGTCRTFIRSGAQIFEIVKQSVWPSVSRLLGTNNLEELRILHHRILAINSLFAIISLIAISILGKELFAIWTHGKITPPSYFLTLQAVALIPNAIWNTSSVIMEASNKHEKFSVYFFIISVTNAFLISIMPSNFGMLGISIVNVAIETSLVFLVLRLTSKIILEKPLTIAQKSFRSAFTTLLHFNRKSFSRI